MRQHPIGNGTLSARIPREVAAVVDALQLRGATTDALQMLGKADWEELLGFCEVANLTLPLAQVSSADFPLWVRDRIAKNLEDNCRRFERICASYKEAASALGNAGVPFLLLKGFAQAPEYVCHPRFRQQSDLDFYCPQEDIPKGLKALERIGYKPSGATEYYKAADHVPTMSRPGNWKWRGNAFDPEMPVSIELHFCMWNSGVSKIALPEVEEFWKRRVERTIDGLSFPALNPIDHLAFFALHIVRGIVSGDWIVHHVLELARFLHNHARDDRFWREWESVHGSRLRNHASTAFAIAEKWFSCTLHGNVRAEIESSPAAQRCWIERFGGFPLEVMFRRTREGRLLHLILTDSWTARRSVLRLTFVPGSLNGHCRPLLNTRFRRTLPHQRSLPIAYVAYQMNRLVGATKSALVFLVHGAELWLSSRRLPGAFWLFLIASFFFNLGVSVYFFLFNLFLTRHGYTEAQLGLLTSAMAAGTLTGAWPAAQLIRRSGIKRAIVACILFAPAVLGTRLFWLQLSEQIAFAFLAGVVLSLWGVCFAPMVAKTAPEKERPFAFSLMFSSGIGVGALGAIAGSRIPGWLGDLAPRLHLPLSAPDRFTLVLACGFAALGIFPAAGMRVPGSTMPAPARPLFSKPLMRFLPAVAMWGLVTTSFSPFANVFLAVHLRMPLQQVGTVFSISQLMQVVGVLCVPLIFRRWGLTNGILSAQLATSLCFVLLATSTGFFFCSAVYVALTAFQWMNEPGLYSVLMDIVPEEQRAGASASMSFTLSCAQLVAGALAGWGFAHLGYPAVLSAIAVTAVIAALMFRTIPDPGAKVEATAVHEKEADPAAPLTRA